MLSCTNDVSRSFPTACTTNESLLLDDISIQDMHQTKDGDIYPGRLVPSQQLVTNAHL